MADMNRKRKLSVGQYENLIKDDEYLPVPSPKRNKSTLAESSKGFNGAETRRLSNEPIYEQESSSSDSIGMRSQTPKVVIEPVEGNEHGTKIADENDENSE